MNPWLVALGISLAGCLAKKSPEEALGPQASRRVALSPGFFIAATKPLGPVARLGLQNSTIGPMRFHGEMLARIETHTLGQPDALRWEACERQRGFCQSGREVYAKFTISLAPGEYEVLITPCNAQGCGPSDRLTWVQPAAKDPEVRDLMMAIFATRARLQKLGTTLWEIHSQALAELKSCREEKLTESASSQAAVTKAHEQLLYLLQNLTNLQADLYAEFLLRLPEKRLKQQLADRIDPVIAQGPTEGEWIDVEGLKLSGPAAFEGVGVLTEAKYIGQALIGSTQLADPIDDGTRCGALAASTSLPDEMVKKAAPLCLQHALSLTDNPFPCPAYERTLANLASLLTAVQAAKVDLEKLKGRLTAS